MEAFWTEHRRRSKDAADAREWAAQCWNQRILDSPGHVTRGELREAKRVLDYAREASLCAWREYRHPGHRWAD